MEEATAAEELNALQRFGRDIRRVRVGRKLNQEQLAKAAGYTAGYVSKVEAGKLLPSMRFAEGCDRAFGTNGLFAGLLHRIEEGDHPSQFIPYVQLEQKASQILDFKVNALPGLLQTEDYAQAIFRAGHPRESAEVIQGKVSARLSRRAILDRPRPPALWVVLHEACLRTPVGGPAVMAVQLRHLLAMADRPGIDFQVLPYSAGAVAAHSLPFILLAFDAAPAVLYSDDPQGGKLFRSTATVNAALEDYDRMRAHALPPDDSVVLVRTLYKEYSHGR